MPQPTARLHLRLGTDDKARITRAAGVRGVPVSTFGRAAVLREAEAVLAAELSPVLSREESLRFLAELDKPFNPVPRLKKAMTEAARIAAKR